VANKTIALFILHVTLSKNRPVFIIIGFHIPVDICNHTAVLLPTTPK